MRLTFFIRYLRLPLQFSPLILIVGSAFLKYGFVVLDHIVDGRQELPVLSRDMINPFEQRPFGTFLLLVIFYSITGELRPLIGETGVGIGRLILLAVVPAMVASMSITGRFFSALNPVAVFGCVARIPIAYATLLLILIALASIPVLLFSAVGDSMTSIWRVESFLPGYALAMLSPKTILIGAASQACLLYVWLTMFACTGGLIYEYRLELGVEPAESPERRAVRADREMEKQRDKIWDRICAEVRGGAFASAGESVRKLIAESSQPLAEYRWLYARAAAATERRFAEFLAQRILPLLLDARAAGEAVEIVRERLALSPDFRPTAGADALRLAKLARDAGDRGTARRLLADFDRLYPNDAVGGEVRQVQSELRR